ncbi:MAG: hypothetical protein K9N05_03045 [Candidatus Marinimicrobia bacterium]|nr:hypothetical protein [Candidatus Neomarinimicrobiota bacterium]
MKKLLIIAMVLLNCFLFADDLYFKNGTVWKNCKLIDRVGSFIEIDFNEKYEKIITKKTY